METFSALLAICAGNSPVPVNFPHKGQWRGALMFALICVWINAWVNNRKAGDLRRYCAHYDVIVMQGGIWVAVSIQFFFMLLCMIIKFLSMDPCDVLTCLIDFLLCFVLVISSVFDKDLYDTFTHNLQGYFINTEAITLPPTGQSHCSSVYEVILKDIDITYLGWMTQICVNELGHHWFR